MSRRLFPSRREERKQSLVDLDEKKRTERSFSLSADDEEEKDEIVLSLSFYQRMPKIKRVLGENRIFQGLILTCNELFCM